MKMKKLAKSQRKLKKSIRKLGKKNTPAWVSALAAVAGAVASALTDERKRGRLKDIALDTKDRAKRLTHRSSSSDENPDEMPDGMVMEESPGPV